eukprot:CAMPEP_0171710296 /NCGR_PEP_ID=MMETSP0991-20121206/15933_1 /TAXON_ID=483369 /ORGANISM="non described non described, Strain CCMP2098" /LENGTH=350 /DNA_ID=CAMNT_0012300455 /DNA_START=101 /DNA_END=1153 /DNA_ORIENTATION=+
MPSGTCYSNEQKSTNLDSAMVFASFTSLGAAVLVAGATLSSPAQRKWPKRIVSLLGVSVVLVEMSFSMGSFSNFSNLRVATLNDDVGFGEDDEGPNTKPGRLCLAQGILFQWSVGTANVMDRTTNECLLTSLVTQWSINTLVLLFLWFQYAQFLMLYQRTPSTIVKQREPYVLGCILGTASLVTILPALTGHIGHRHSFYSCWVEGPYYYLFYGKLSVVMLLSMRWCLLTMNRLSEISTSLVGMDRPAALRSLAVYRAGNVCLAGGAAFVLTVILLYDFFPDSPLVCVLTSADILLFPFIYAVFVHGYTCSEAMHRCCDSTRSRLGWEEEEEEEGHESSLAASRGAAASV